MKYVVYHPLCWQQLTINLGFYVVLEQFVEAWFYRKFGGLDY